MTLRANAEQSRDKQLGQALKTLRLSKGYMADDVATLCGIRLNAIKDLEDKGIGFPKYAELVLRAVGVWDMLSEAPLKQRVLDAVASIPKPVEQTLFIKALAYLLLNEEKIKSNYIPSDAVRFLGMQKLTFESLLRDGSKDHQMAINKIVRNYKFTSQQALVDEAMARGFDPEAESVVQVSTDPTEKLVNRMMGAKPADPSIHTAIFGR